MKRLFATVLLGILLVSCGGATGIPVSVTDTPVPPTQTEVPPTPTATPTAVPSGPCDNPLMALNVGNQWVYRSPPKAEHPPIG